MKAFGALAVFAGTIILSYPIHRTARLRRYHKLIARRKMLAYSRNAKTFEQALARGDLKLRIRA